MYRRMTLTSSFIPLRPGLKTIFGHKFVRIPKEPKPVQLSYTIIAFGPFLERFLRRDLAASAMQRSKVK